MSNKKVIFHDLGLIDYKTCWDYQTNLFDETVQQKIANRKTLSTAKKTSNHLIFCHMEKKLYFYYQELSVQIHFFQRK